MASTLVLIWLATVLGLLYFLHCIAQRQEAWDRSSEKIQRAAQDAEPLLNADSWE